MTSALAERCFRTCVAAILVAISGCASLPSDPQRHSSVALSESVATPLAGIAKAFLSDPLLSGFRLEPIAAYAFDVRLELAARATRTLDVQYYVLHDDDTGKNLLIALRE